MESKSFKKEKISFEKRTLKGKSSKEIFEILNKNISIKKLINDLSKK